MHDRTHPLAPAALVAAVVLALAVIMLGTAGPVEALVLLAVIAALLGMYALRHHARGRPVRRRSPAGAGEGGN